MAAYTKAEKAEALERLREWLKPGDTVYTLVTHVSSSGMSRSIRFLIPKIYDGDKVEFLHPNHAIGVALGLRFHTRRGFQTDSLIVHGCGMDICWHTVDRLSGVLGYKLNQRGI